MKVWGKNLLTAAGGRVGVSRFRVWSLGLGLWTVLDLDSGFELSEPRVLVLGFGFRV